VKINFATITYIFFCFDRYVFAPLQQPAGLEIQIRHVSAPRPEAEKFPAPGILGTRLFQMYMYLYVFKEFLEI
jgi:hypothetical protein